MVSKSLICKKIKELYSFLDDDDDVDEFALKIISK